MNRFASYAVVAAWLLVSGAPVSAQEAASDPPAHIAAVDGTASLERDGRPDPAPISMPLLAGDRLKTADGRVEILFADGATLHVDSASTVDFLSDEVIRLLDGRVRLTIPGPRRAVSYRIDAPSGWVQIHEPGEYRVAVTAGARDTQVELVVLRGAADLLNDDGQTTLNAGQRAFAAVGAAPSYAYVYNSAAWDSFDRWSDSRRSERAGISSQYLPETVRAYSSTFDRDGSWQYDTSYGYVWYPTTRAGWRPYFYGRWASVPSFGWTWIGTDAWSWPTHHYGRWGFSAAGSWFWIPGRTWAPAWVSWAYAPGYVSWCPLGWDNRPAMQFRAAAGYYGGRYDVWNAWTVLPHQRFGSGYVNSGYVGGSRFDARTRDAFVIRQAGPDVRGVAVSRGAAPIYAAGTRRGGPAGDSAGLNRPTGQAAGDPRARAATGSSANPQRSAAGEPRPRAPLGGTPNAPRSTPADDAAAFRSRRPGESPSGAGYPAPARTPRDAADVVQRMGTPRERTVAPRSGDPADVPVYRGGVVRRPDTSSEDRTQTGSRLEVPGYRRAPSSGQPAPGASSPPAQRTWSAGERQTGSPRSEPYTPNYSNERGRQGPDRQPNDAYRVAPRPAPDSAPPQYRPYGGGERRAPSGPSPSAAPPREQAPPPAAAPPRGEGQGRPSGQQQSERGSAARRRGGN